MVNPIRLMIATSALLSAPLVHGHGYMTKPKTSSTAGDVTAYAGTIDGPAALPGSNYNWDPTSNTKDFTANFNKSQYKTLRDLIKAKSNAGECGYTVLGAPQELPDQIEWSHGSEGFTPSHEGPCEVWCDDNRVFKNENCAKNYRMVPALLPYDKAGCANAKRLTFYWLALHGPQWQVYVSCAALSGTGAAPAATPATVAPTPASAPTISPAYVPASTPAPAIKTGNAYTPSSTPAPAIKTGNAYTPSSTPSLAPAPAPTKSCGIKRD